jgi:hypothetical protein
MSIVVYVYSKFQRNIPKYLLQRKLEGHQVDLVHNCKRTYIRSLLYEILSLLSLQRYLDLGYHK